MFDPSHPGAQKVLTTELHDLNLSEVECYRIHALGVFNPCWLDMLSGDWVIADQPAAQPGATLLVGRVVDQAALLGVLNYLYDLGLPLLSVVCLTNGGDVNE